MLSSTFLFASTINHIFISSVKHHHWLTQKLGNKDYIQPLMFVNDFFRNYGLWQEDARVSWKKKKVTFANPVLYYLKKKKERKSLTCDVTDAFVWLTFTQTFPRAQRLNNPMTLNYNIRMMETNNKMKIH